MSSEAGQPQPSAAGRRRGSSPSLDPHRLRPADFSSPRAAGVNESQTPRAAADPCRVSQDACRHQPARPLTSQPAGASGIPHLVQNDDRHRKGDEPLHKGDESSYSTSVRGNLLDNLPQQHAQLQHVSASDAAPTSAGRVLSGAPHPDCLDAGQPLVQPSMSAGDKPPALPSSHGPGSFDTASGNALSRSAEVKQPAQPSSPTSGDSEAAAASAKRGQTRRSSPKNASGAVHEKGVDEEVAAAGSAAHTASAGEAKGSTGLQGNKDAGMGDPPSPSPAQQHTSLNEPDTSDQKHAAGPVRPSGMVQLETLQQEQLPMHGGSLRDGFHSMSKKPAEQKQAASPAQPPAAQQWPRPVSHPRPSGNHNASHGCSTPASGVLEQQLRQLEPSVFAQGHHHHEPPLHSVKCAPEPAKGPPHVHQGHSLEQPQADWYPAWYAGFISRKAPSIPASAAVSNPQVGTHAAGVSHPPADQRPQPGTSEGNVQTDDDSPTTELQPPSAGKRSKTPSRQVARVADWHQSGPVLMPPQMSHHPCDRDAVVYHGNNHMEPHERSQSDMSPEQHAHSPVKHSQPTCDGFEAVQGPHQQAGDSEGDWQHPPSDGLGAGAASGCNTGQNKNAASSSPMTPRSPHTAQPSLDHQVPQLAAYLEAQKGAGGWSGAFNLPAHVSGTTSKHPPLHFSHLQGDGWHE